LRIAALVLLLLAGCTESNFNDRTPDVHTPDPDSDTDPDEVPDLPVPVAQAPLYANTTNELFEIDPADGTMTSVGVFMNGNTKVDGMVDIAISMEGLLYGGTFDALWYIDPETANLKKVCDIDVAMYALTFTSEGDLVAGSDDNIEIIDLDTCKASYLVKNSRYVTSGDLVGLPDGYLYWSVRGKDRDDPDGLVRVDPKSGNEVFIGNIGFGSLYGMAYYDEQLYGFSSKGQMVRIQPNSANSMLLGYSEDLSWWGATTNPVVWN
jgi:hypothetical protein